MAAPRRYDDPAYAELARQVEGRLGLPMGILDAIRTQGERSNANQISPAGAQTVYQFIPATRRGMMRVHGVDPYAGPEQATTAAGYHLLDDYQRTGSWDTAIARYHGGSDTRNWGPRTMAYIQRVGSFDNQAPGEYRGETLATPDQPEINPMTGEVVVRQGTEPVKFAAPDDSAAPSKPVAGADEPAIRHRRGILGALQSIFMPDPGSLWAGALRNGIFNARESQQTYRDTQAQRRQQMQGRDIELQTSGLDLKNRLVNGTYQIAGNNIVHTPPSGGRPEIIAPPQQPTEVERLIQAWQAAPPGSPIRALLERAIRGYQYSPEYIAEDTRRREATARARPRATPRPPANSGLPAGAVLLPD